MTLWRPLPHFPGYEVSSLGQIRNARTGRELALQRSDSGYLKARIWRGGKRRAVFAHKAVLEAFVGPAPTKRHDAAHLDGRQTHNCARNLAWKTPEENEADKKRTCDARKKYASSFTGYKDDTHVPVVRQLLAYGLSYSRVARHVGLHRSSVSRIARGLRRRAA